MLPTPPGTAGVGFGTQVEVNPPPVPWQPVAQLETINTQLARRAAGLGVPFPDWFTRPVSVAVNNTTNRPCIWSYRTVPLSITQLKFDRGSVGHS